MTFFPITFHLYSFKESPPKRSCQSITPTSEVQATVSREEPSPPIQQQTLGFRVTEPFQPANFRFPKKLCGKQNRAFQSKWFLEFRWLHYNEQNDSVFCIICVQQNAKLNLRAVRNKQLAFISKRFSNLEKGNLVPRDFSLAWNGPWERGWEKGFDSTQGALTI